MNQPINAGPFWDNASLCPDARYVKAIGEAPSSLAAGLPRLETHQLLPENSLLSLQTHFGPEPEETEQPRPRGPTQSQSGSFPGTGYAGPRGHKRGSDTDPPTHTAAIPPQYPLLSPSWPQNPRAQPGTQLWLPRFEP